MPINLAQAMGHKLIALLNNIENGIEVSQNQKIEQNKSIQISLFEGVNANPSSKCNR